MLLFMQGLNNMFYTFNVNGLYTGTSATQTAYSTTVAPPDENITHKWVWNHVNWVGLPLTWQYVPATYNPPPVVETPTEPTPPTE